MVARILSSCFIYRHVREVNSICDGLLEQNQRKGTDICTELLVHIRASFNGIHSRAAVSLLHLLSGTSLYHSTKLKYRMLHHVNVVDAIYK
jgi:hypothetical protein